MFEQYEIKDESTLCVANLFTGPCKMESTLILKTAFRIYV
jgi:hypothetical protein